MAQSLAVYLRSFVLLLGLGLITACTGPFQADATPQYAAHVMDARTGQTLFEDNADTKLHPASLTKMMTLYIAFQEVESGRLSLDTMVTVSANAAAQPPSRLGLKSGQKIALRYLIRAAAVKSANDAATAIGDFIGGDQATFAARMTKTSKMLGMKNTTFKNANGLTQKGHLSTAADMSTLGRRLFYDFPMYYNIFSRRTTDAGVVEVANTNRRFLDAYEGADGIKTGYTDAAGFNLTASAERDGVRIIATVFGGASTADRNAKVAKLLDKGFALADPNVSSQPTQALPVGDDELLVSQVDEALPEVEGGAGKTIRVAMALNRSPRPIARPNLEGAEEAATVVAALEGEIEGALASASLPPPAPGTFEFQAAAIEAGNVTAAVVNGETVMVAATEVAAAVEDATKGAAIAEAAIADVADAANMDAANMDAGSVDLAAIDAALNSALDEAIGSAIDLALEEPRPLSISGAAIVPTVVLSEAPRPPKRNKPIYDSAAGSEEVLLVAADGSEPSVEPALAEVTQPEAIAAALVATTETPSQPAAEIPVEDIILAEVAATTVEEQPQTIQTRVSTSGGRQFGVSIGIYGSSYEAERAILRAQLADTSNLAEGLRKVIRKKGGFEAAIMGLTDAQAEQGCRRLTARAFDCETVGS